MLLIIDGSELEGGGQITRLSLSMAAIFETPIRIHSIRKGRHKPGLQAQHLECCRVVNQISGGSLQLDKLKSTDLEFIPGPRLLQSSYLADCKTAGSITLMLQASLPCLIVSDGHSRADKVQITFCGGTNVNYSPSIDHSINILFPILSKMGVDINIDEYSRGFNPKGGGDLKLTVRPISQLLPLTLTVPGQILSIRGIIYGDDILHNNNDIQVKLLEGLKSIIFENFNHLEESNINVDIAPIHYNNDNNNNVNETNSSTTNISTQYNCSSEISQQEQLKEKHLEEKQDTEEHEEYKSFNPKRPRKDNLSKAINVGIELIAYTSTGCILNSNAFLQTKITSNNDIKFDKLITQAFQKFKAVIDSDACVDEHTADQLIIYMAICKEPSQILCEPRFENSSLHIESAIHICNLFIENRDVAQKFQALRQLYRNVCCKYVSPLTFVAIGPAARIIDAFSYKLISWVNELRSISIFLESPLSRRTI
eukprot:gene5408-10817_t